MAKWTITRACGHIEEHQLFGPGKDRQNRADWLKSTDCSDCYHKSQSETAAQQTSDLPAIEGTDKQIQWAITLRAKVAQQLYAIVAQCSSDTDADVIADAKVILRQARAAYWIDNRHLDARDLLKRRADKRSADALLKS